VSKAKVKKEQPPPAPERDKLCALHGAPQPAGDFLTWLLHSKRLVLCERHEHDNACGAPIMRRDPILSEYRDHCGIRAGHYYPAAYDLTKLLAEFFHIDLQKLEDEKRALLDYLRRTS
jgi:hypothetical protein